MKMIIIRPVGNSMKCDGIPRRIKLRMLEGRIFSLAFGREFREIEKSVRKHLSLTISVLQNPWWEADCAKFPEYTE